MAGQPYIYSGQGFSLQRDKNRFVLPNVLRSTVRDSSGSDILCLSRHPEWKCLVGFGLSRVDEFEEQLRLEEERAHAAGREFNWDLRAMALYTFQKVPFDGSGRFVLPDALSALGGVGERLYFHGLGRSFTVWNPEELYLHEGEAAFEATIATCRALEAAELAKAKKK